jgi:predicted transposase YbfD/YdcC
MDVEAPRGLLRYFNELEDSRMERTKRHTLTDILVIAISAVVCGAEGWTQVEEFGNAKQKWFQTFLNLPNGIPSHDTFGRVFAQLEPEAFERCFLKWIEALAHKSQGRLIAVDGKTIRRSLDQAGGKAAIHMVSAWCQSNQLVLGQVATEAKSNEITAIPKLLELLDLEDAVVSTDAMGCQKRIAQQIVDQKGDYLLQLKANQGNLYEEVKLLFEKDLRSDSLDSAYATAESTNGGHGRVEHRRVWTTENVGWCREHKDWEGLRSFICIESQRLINGHLSQERRYYISSMAGGDPDRILALIRGHWGVENNLHWCLDVQFREDDCRIRKGYGAENFSRLNRIALNLLKRQTNHKAGIKTKRLRAGWDNAYLLKVLTQDI